MNLIPYLYILKTNLTLKKMAENQTQEQQKPVSQAETKKGKSTQVPPSDSIKSVDKATYDRFTSLKFLQLSFIDSDQKLEEKDKKELEALEKELKICDGKKSIRTQRAAINNEQVLIVEGIPLPAEYLTIIMNSKNPAYYIGE